MSSGYWRCRSCSDSQIDDRLLSVGGGLREVHRLTCGGCGEVGHYDVDLTQREQPAETTNGKFEWVTEQAEGTQHG